MSVSLTQCLINYRLNVRISYMSTENIKSLVCITKRTLCWKKPEVHMIKIKKGSIQDDSLKKATFIKTMGIVPQPVVVVSTGEYDTKEGRLLKRGVTCSSFTSVSLDPPIVSFCVNNPSRFHNILKTSKHFAVNVLAKDQVRLGVHFSKPALEDMNQFKSVPHEEGIQGIPILSDCSAVLQCKAHCVHEVGDHYVWYGQVIDAHVQPAALQPLLYYTRSVGDEIFLKAFEDATLPFEDWTHEAHLRMAWNYIREYGRESSVSHIRKGIQRYNEQNKDKVKTGYHETVTIFYIHMVSEAMSRCDSLDTTFEEFISENPHLVERNLILSYYSKEKIAEEESKRSFIEPDRKALPV